MKNLEKPLSVLLFILILTSSILVACAHTVNAEPTTDPIVEWLPIVPPKPIEVENAVDPTAAMEYNVLTGEEFLFPSDNPSQQPVETGSTSTPPSPGLLPSANNPESVIGADGRTLVPYSTTTTYPWRTIVKLEVTAADGTHWMGSGSIIGPSNGHSYHILTAGHVIYMHDHGGWASSVKVIPGFDGYQTEDFREMPYNYAWATYYRSYTGWTVSADHSHDWAVCTLDRNVGDYTGYMGRMTAGSGSGIYTGTLNTAGYPADRSSGLQMYFDSDSGRTANEYNHWYYMDTYGGQSGSPVWRLEGDNRYTLTVHAYGNDGSGSNHGTRLNQDKYDRINTWLAADTPPTDKADLTDDGQSYSGFSPTTVYAGTTSFSANCDVRNFGTASSGGFYVSYYASTNNIISTSDYLIGNDYVSSISPFQYKDSSLTLTFPSTIPEGEYYVGWIIDRTGLVNEFDEGNNIAYKSSPKLTVNKHTITFYTDPSTVGSITFAGTTYTHTQSGKYAGGSYTVTANTPPGYVFSNWVTTGGVSISGSTATVTGTGTIKAVFTPVTASFKIWTDKSSYSIGETMYVYIRVKNPGTALPARVVIAVKPPTGSYRILLDTTTTLPASLDTGDILYESFTLPTAPFGTYVWTAALLNPSTGALISLDTWNWQISP